VGYRGNFRRRSLLLIGGIALAGLAVAVFGFSAALIGSYTLALGLMVSIGIFSSLHGMASVTSLLLLVPDQMRGRVMGVHSVTYTIPTLGAMPLGAIANVIGAPIAVGISGLALTVFALGPALANKRMRRLSLLVRKAERSRRNRV
jgi:MFS family permease